MHSMQGSLPQQRTCFDCILSSIDKGVITAAVSHCTAGACRNKACTCRPIEAGAACNFASATKEGTDLQQSKIDFCKEYTNQWVRSRFVTSLMHFQCHLGVKISYSEKQGLVFASNSPPLLQCLPVY